MLNSKALLALTNLILNCTLNEKAKYSIIGQGQKQSYQQSKARPHTTQSYSFYAC